MKTIQHLAAQYTKWLWAFLAPLGAWGVFAIAAIDGAFLGLPMDPVVATYVYQNRSTFFLYVFMASSGSVVGCLAIYGVGYLGGETFLRKRIPPERFARIHASFEKHPFWGLMFPAMLPPPTPFKLFVLAAAVTEMRLSQFMLAIFCGRLVRFSILALLVLQFGPQIVELTAHLVKDRIGWVLAGFGVCLLVWLLWQRKKKATPRSVARTTNSEESA